MPDWNLATVTHTEVDTNTNTENLEFSLVVSAPNWLRAKKKKKKKSKPGETAQHILI